MRHSLLTLEHEEHQKLTFVVLFSPSFFAIPAGCPVYLPFCISISFLHSLFTTTSFPDCPDLSPLKYHLTCLVSQPLHHFYWPALSLTLLPFILHISSLISAQPVVLYSTLHEDNPNLKEESNITLILPTFLTP